MNWVFIGLAVALFVGWMILRVVLAIPLGVLNLLWMFAILMVILWGAQRFA
jgi:high-affinity Fe2+/Pb2+ permease